MFKKANHESGQRKRGGIVAAMYASVMGMANSCNPILLAETAAQKQNFVTLGRIAMSGGVVRFSCKRLFEKRKPASSAVRHDAMSERSCSQH
jgi:hypothetical protein